MMFVWEMWSNQIKSAANQIARIVWREPLMHVVRSPKSSQKLWESFCKRTRKESLKEVILLNNYSRRIEVWSVCNNLFPSYKKQATFSTIGKHIFFLPIGYLLLDFKGNKELSCLSFVLLIKKVYSHCYYHGCSLLVASGRSHPIVISGHLSWLD